MLREALQHIVNHPQKDKVWFTRPSEIYDHCAALPARQFPRRRSRYSTFYGMQDKRAAMKDGAPNPFVKPGEFATYVAGLEVDFDKATSGVGRRRVAAATP